MYYKQSWYMGTFNFGTKGHTLHEPLRITGNLKLQDYTIVLVVGMLQTRRLTLVHGESIIVNTMGSTTPIIDGNKRN
jgi:hypothetical protein